MKPKHKIVITGPESVGKSVLLKELASYFKSDYVLEIARDFIENLKHDYKLNDVLEIAKLRIQKEIEFRESEENLVFLDTDLIVTKVWLKRAFNFVPDWIIEHLLNEKPSLHLLCYPDIPWEDDPVRENSEIREGLFDEYKNEIINLNIPYFVVEGINQQRTDKAIKFVKDYIKSSE